MTPTSTETGGRTQGRSVLGRLAQKLLAPVVTTAAGALASYAAKNAPRIFEQVVLPKLREARRSADCVVRDIPDQARGVAEGVGDLSHDLASRVSGSDGEASRGARPTQSTAHLEERREARAERRAARRKASTT